MGALVSPYTENATKKKKKNFFFLSRVCRFSPYTAQLVVFGKTCILREIQQTGWRKYHIRVGN